jgi:hypothetical protein
MSSRGDGHRRIEAPPTTSRNVKRRPSKGSSAVDRQGKVFSDSEQDSTVRVVTPEPKKASAHVSSSRELQEPRSPKSISRTSNGRTEHSTSLSNTDDEGKIENKRRKDGRINNPGEPQSPSDASPSSLVSRTRQRLGSLAASSAFNSRPADLFGSIGYPSISESPPLPNEKTRQRLSKTPRRSFSANTALDLNTMGSQSPPSLSTDSTRILQLMKITCGRMHGILFFRPTNIAAWESGYCAINVAPGSLVYQVKGDIAMTKTLIPDLRGCSVRTQYDAETQATYLNVVTASSGLGFQLRPPVPETFDSWLAALLCWQPLRPKGIQNLKTAKAQLSTVDERSRATHLQLSDPTIQPSTTVIKVGQMLLWQTSKPPPFSLRDAHARHPATQDHFWRRVNCTLKENGYFQLLAESDSTLTSLIRLPLLFRNAVQHLDSSVLGEEYCIAIYPQYHVQHNSKLPQQPVFLALDSREHFEAWFVLLRAFTVPELYGPEPDAMEDTQSPLEEERSGTSSTKINMTGLFRVERTLSIRIIEARIKPRIQGDFYTEVLLDRHVRARTSTKSHTTSVFWAEEFSFNDLPPVVSNTCILVKGGNPAEREWTMVAHGPWDISQSEDLESASTDIEVMSHDTVHGKLEIQLDSLEQERITEKWWPLLDNNHRVAGDVLLKIQLEENVVLMQKEYSNLSKLLHNFDNGITTQIAQVLQSDPKQLADVFLDIFQITDSVTDWLVGLVDEEIDGIYRDTQPTRMRFSNRLHSNDSYESAENRELLVRDLSRTATMEANLLFRGNSILTKALDAHMRRLGGDYLHESVADIIKAIVESDPDCEIDPSRIRSQDQLEANQENLTALTRSIWQAVIESASSCPHKLRLIFRHIRSCAEDRYGSFIRTVGYTSVSGFLFLRLICPALLNPKLFGLVDGTWVL